MSFLLDEAIPISQRIFAFAAQHMNKTLDNDTMHDAWRRFEMTRDEYKELIERLKSDDNVYKHYMASVGSDCDASSSPLTMTLRNPGATHQDFCASLAKEIRRLLFESDLYHVSSPCIQQIQYPITCEGYPWSKSIKVNEGSPRCEIQRRPDLAFAYRHRDYPPLIIEVACSQKLEDLQALAESYIVDSHHEIKYVIGIDISPCIRPVSSSAAVSSCCSYSVWVPAVETDAGTGQDVGTCKKIIDMKPFRYGNHTLTGSLDIPIAAFVPDAVAGNFCKEHCQEQITVQFSDLSRSLDRAMACEPTNGNPLVHKPVLWRKRRRSLSDNGYSGLQLERQTANGGRTRSGRQTRHGINAAHIKQEP